MIPDIFDCNILCSENCDIKYEYSGSELLCLITLDFFLTYSDYGMFVVVRNFRTVYIYSTKKSSDFLIAIFYEKKILVEFIDMFSSRYW